MKKFIDFITLKWLFNLPSLINEIEEQKQVLFCLENDLDVPEHLQKHIKDDILEITDYEDKVVFKFASGNETIIKAKNE